jgi:hypothetical protein
MFHYFVGVWFYEYLFFYFIFSFHFKLNNYIVSYYANPYMIFFFKKYINSA